MSEKFTGSLKAIADRSIRALPGWIGLPLILAVKAVAITLFVSSLPATDSGNPEPLRLITGILLFIAGMIMWNGLFIVQPNQAEVLTLFGRYLGSVKRDGWSFTNPLATKKKISLRIRNFNSPQLKVNDADGNPIEIAAVVVWRVVDTARASFDVENYTSRAICPAVFVKHRDAGPGRRLSWSCWLPIA